MLYTINPDLYIDEAYYWVWSQNFDWGYYSKPPMIAWVISLATGLAGESSLVMKSISILLYPITSVALYLTAKELFNDKIALFSGMLFFTSPAVSLSSFIISTDVVLLFFWALTLYAFVRAIKSDKLIFWILAGVFGGLGLLSKYNMILFVVSAFLFLIFSKEHRYLLFYRRFYLTLLIALLIFLPNLLWNYNNGFISFVHLYEISQVEKKLFHFDKLFEFLGAQFGVFGPISFALLLYAFAVVKKQYKDDNFMMFFWFSFVFLAVISLQAFLARAFANWAAPTYVAGSILVASLLIQKNRTKLLQWAISINILLMVLMYHYEPIMKLAGVELQKKNDPFVRIKGWKEFGKKITKVYEHYPNHLLLANSRKEVSELIYYVYPHPFNTKIFNPHKRMQNYYHQTQDLNNDRGKNFIYISRYKSIKNMSKYFEEIDYIKQIKIPIHKNFSREYHIFELKNFKGY